MTAPQCDSFAAWTTAAPFELAWSQCDDPFYRECDVELYDEPYDDENESSSRWKWALVIAAWAAGAAAFTVVVAMAFVTFTPQQTPAPHSSTVSPSTPQGAFIGNHWDGEPAQNT